MSSPARTATPPAALERERALRILRAHEAQLRALGVAQRREGEGEVRLPPGAGAAGRPRVPSSKHFSTFVSTASGDEKAQGKDKAAGNGASNGSASVHPLRNTYVRTLLRARAAVC